MMDPSVYGQYEGSEGTYFDGSGEEPFFEHAMVGLETPITALSFDAVHELLWVGCKDGTVSTLQCPTLESYAYWKVQDEPIIALEPLGDLCLALAPGTARMQRAGGPSAYTVRASQDSTAEGDEFASCAAHLQSGSLYIGTAGGRLLQLSARDGETVTEVQIGETSGEDVEGISALCVVSGGMTLAAGTTDGSVKFYDLRASFSSGPISTVFAHQGPVCRIAASVPRGDMVATTGLFGRYARSSPDRQVCLIDARRGYTQSAPLMHPYGASWVGFLPSLGSTAIVASAHGQVTMTDVMSSAALGAFQIPSLLTSVALSSSGECLAVGGEDGTVRLWTSSEELRVNHYSEPIDVPEKYQYWGPRIDEGTPFTVLPPFSPFQYVQEMQSRGVPAHHLSAHFSDENLERPVWVGAAPRAVHQDVLPFLNEAPSIRPGVLVGDNPAYAKGGTKASAAKELHQLRSVRAQPAHKSKRKADAKDPETAHQQELIYSSLLPKKFQAVEIRLPALDGKMPFAEFDFSFFNRTRFAGLENDAANAYCNALLQALFFTPQVASLLLSLQPNPQEETSLVDELAFLAHMLRTSAPGSPCQPANLVATLRQSREAIGLGLLESQGKEMSGVTGNKGDIEAMASVDRSLSRRVQTLARFLIDELRNRVEKRVIEDLFSAVYSQRVLCIKDSSAEQKTQQKTTVLELSYPDIDAVVSVSRAKSMPPKAAELPSSALNATAAEQLRLGNPTAATWKGKKPTFADVLHVSIVKQQSMRAWFDERRGYQPVVQDRIPIHMPDIFMVGTGLHETANIVFWHPTTDESGNEKPWLPGAVEVAWDADARRVAVRQGETPETLEGDAPGPSFRRVVYTLGAVVSHVTDPRPAHDSAERPSSLPDARKEGHLLTQVRLLSCYLGGKHSLPASPMPPTPGLSPLAPGWHHGAQAGSPERDRGGGEGQGSSTTERSASGPGDGATQHRDAAARGGPLSTPLVRKDTSFKGPGLEEEPLQEGDWLLLNDFAVSKCTEEEARSICGGLKAPALLIFQKVASYDGGSMSTIVQVPYEVPSVARPVMDPRTFDALCHEAPINAGHTDLLPLKFRPLDMAKEAPQPGMKVAIDTEFVQMAPAESVFRDGVQIVLRPPRLSLARISVLRGEDGKGFGECFIDDHVKRTEPVWDYLTRFSGVQPGDLDQTMSRHHLVTLKKAYMKLRYLVDSGCVFIGHGLRKDFKMINIVVPPTQIIDTVELFHFKHQRKLSLRFLASYLLGMHIQQEVHDSIEDARVALLLYRCVHDSIEDARVALLLYRKYEELVKEGTLEVTMLEMYRFGKAQGWDPTAWTVQPGTMRAP